MTGLKRAPWVSVLGVAGLAAPVWGDVAFVDTFSQVAWNGVIGVGGDSLSYNQLDSTGWTSPPDVIFNLGVNHTPVNYNEDDNFGPAGWWGRNETHVWSRGAYYVNGTLGVAARVDAGVSNVNTSSGAPVLLSTGSSSQYKLRINVTTPTTYRLVGRGQYAGVFTSMKFGNTTTGGFAYWSIFNPDGEQAVDQTGTLDPGVWLLEIYHGANVFGDGSGANDSHYRLIVGSVIGAGCNLADITEVGGTSEAPGLPDQQLTVDDLILFVNLFSDGTGCPGATPCSRADITGIGGPPESPDGELTVDDLIAFVNAYSEGC